MAAHLDRVDLSAHGFYSTPDVTGCTCLPLFDAGSTEVKQALDVQSRGSGTLSLTSHLPAHPSGACALRNAACPCPFCSS